jgi:hypothetical protein
MLSGKKSPSLQLGQSKEQKHQRRSFTVDPFADPSLSSPPTPVKQKTKLAQPMPMKPVYHSEVAEYRDEFVSNVLAILSMPDPISWDDIITRVRSATPIRTFRRCSVLT